MTADNGDYYSKPQLSNALTHKKEAHQLALFTKEKFAQQFNIDIKSHILLNSLDDLDELNPDFSHVVLATGATPVILPNLKNAHVVNNLADYIKFREIIKNHKNITIVGAGLVGCEFANDLVNAGYQITVIAPEKYPLFNLLPEAAGLGLKKALEQKGVNWQLGRYFQPEDDHGIILSAVGLRSNTALAKLANLTINKGIVVNHYLETSSPDIYALGDCAEVFGQVLPYIQPLTLGARALAKTILGEPTELIYPAMPVHIKTPAYPIVVIPPPVSPENHWEIDSHPDGVVGLCYNQSQLVGLCLTDKQTGNVNEYLAKF